MNVRDGVRPRSSLCGLALLSLCVGAAATRAEAQTKAYVAHSNANAVTVIDTATAMVVGTLPVGAGPAHVAITPDGTRAYVANTGSDSISVIDAASDAVTATISVGDAPSAVAVTPDGLWLYAMTAGGVVEVIDTAQLTVVSTIEVGSTGGIAITPDGARVYVAAGLVYVIDAATNLIVNSFPAEAAAVPDVTNTATAVAVSPDGSRAYVAVVTYNFAGGGFSGGVGSSSWTQPPRRSPAR